MIIYNETQLNTLTKKHTTKAVKHKNASLFPNREVNDVMAPEILTIQLNSQYIKARK